MIHFFPMQGFVDGVQIALGRCFKNAGAEAVTIEGFVLVENLDVNIGLRVGAAGDGFDAVGLHVKRAAIFFANDLFNGFAGCVDRPIGKRSDLFDFAVEFDTEGGRGGQIGAGDT